MQNKPNETAAVIIIGNEILSGQTQDANLSHIAKRLQELGISLCEARVVLDVEADIVAAVNDCRKRYSYVFTTGGIGPTHDDITAAAIAKAFGRAFVRNKEAETLMLARYSSTMPHNEARLRMTDMPEGAVLIPNTVSTAPAFQVENVFVLAGVPNIMHAMFEALVPRLKIGSPIITKSVFCSAIESHLADGLAQIQHEHPKIEIGSYPSWRADHEKGVRLVLKGFEQEELGLAFDKVLGLIKELGATSTILEG